MQHTIHLAQLVLAQEQWTEQITMNDEKQRSIPHIYNKPKRRNGNTNNNKSNI